MGESYRAKFQDVADARKYETVDYARWSYADLIWQIEKDWLSSFIDEFKRGRKPIAYLDFACGTGRIVSYLEDHAGSAVGIDVSEIMLGIAEKKLRRASLIRADITENTNRPEGKYDLITSFRFLLN